LPEHQQGGIPDHDHFKLLSTLAAGGLLNGEEFVDFQAHMKKCSECRSEYTEFSSLLTRELPQAQGSLRQKLSAIGTKPLPYSRQRFLRRARVEGVVFSREVETPARLRPWYLSSGAVTAAVVALVVAAVGLTVYSFRETPATARVKTAAAGQQIAELRRQNSALTTSLSQLNEKIVAEQREIQDLRVQLRSASAIAENLRTNGEQARGGAGQSSSRNAQLLEEARDREKLLAEARDEAARAGQLRINDEASLVEQQVRIVELSNKLRIASATLDMERQLASAGEDVRELMASRQLHVIDVHDSDTNGIPDKAFGRVFLTEGKTLTFYAFDLNTDDTDVNSKRGFQVWAALREGRSARSLGFLRLDARGQGRWVLRVENPAIVKSINSVFVTVEPAAGGKQPSGKKILYAYLGDVNHP